MMIWVLVALGATTLVVVGMLIRERSKRLRAERVAKEIEELAHYLERNRIARELHDAVGHDLTMLANKLDMAIELKSTDPERAEENLAAARVLVGKSVTDMRKSLDSIRDPAFDFTKALVALVAQLKASKTLDVRMKVDANDLTPGRGHEIFRIVQECLNNVQKHSKASEVNVEIARKQNEVEVNISDNGKGFKLDETNQRHGIKGIAERVKKLKGQMELDSSLTRGTTVKVNIPDPDSK
jgi:signal transduction histidine kinase